MAVSLFFANLILLDFICYRQLGGGHNFFTNYRQGFINSALFISCFVFFQIYILSAFDEINFKGIFISNLLLFISLIIYYLFRQGSFPKKADLKLKWKFFFAFLFWCLVFILPLLYLCIIIPPNNTDANTCYLIRVEYWIKNHNIHHFPTQNLFELYYNQLPQFFMLNTRILSGSDYFASIFQFFAYIGSALTVSLISKELGGNWKVQLLSVIICLCLPQAILQSTAAMYDLQSAFAASVCILYFIRILKNPDSNFLKNCIVFSICFAFTSYIKYSSLFFILIFPAFLFISLIRKNFKKSVYFASLLVGIFCLTHLFFFYENYQSFGNPISADTYDKNSDKLINERFDIGSLTSGLIKNISLNFVTPVSSINERLHSGVVKLHQWIDVDINDPKINLNEYFEKYSAAISESTSGNLNMALLIIVAFLIIGIRIIKRKKREVLACNYLLCLLPGFILFSVVFKFQSWNARLQLPFFILMIPPVSILLSDFYLKKKIYFRLLIILLFLSSVPFIYLNYGKPLVSYRALRMIFNKPPSMINKDDYKRFQVRTPSLDNYYQAGETSAFYYLRPNLDDATKKNVFACLDSTDYFSNEVSIMSKTRNNSYLLPAYQNSSFVLDDYQHVIDYLFKTKEHRTNVGLVFGRSAEYPFLAMIRDYPTEKEINWEHIAFYQLKKENPNFYREFYYEKIVTNDNNFVEKIKSNVAYVKSFGSLTVIELMKADSVKYRNYSITNYE